MNCPKCGDSRAEPIIGSFWNCPACDAPSKTPTNCENADSEAPWLRFATGWSLAYVYGIGAGITTYMPFAFVAPTRAVLGQWVKYCSSGVPQYLLEGVLCKKLPVPEARPGGYTLLVLQEVTIDRIIPL